LVEIGKQLGEAAVLWTKRTFSRMMVQMGSEASERVCWARVSDVFREERFAVVSMMNLRRQRLPA
jgi:hypothetical protein